MVVHERRVQEFKRDIHALEIDEMRRQLKQLQEHLDQFENRDHKSEFVNPFLHRQHNDFSDSSTSRHQRRSNRMPYQESDLKVSS